MEAKPRTPEAEEALVTFCIIKLPRVVKLDETKPVTAEISFAEPASISTLAATLASPSFDITPAGENTAQLQNEMLSWSWLVKPKQSGQHALSLQVKRAIFLPLNSVPGLKLQGDTLLAEVTTVNDLGLTSTQQAILGVVGALVGIIGTILGYPLWKRFSERRIVKSGRTRRK